MVTLDAITTVAGTLAPRRTEAINFELVSAHVDDIVLVSDDAMREAARWLWFECGLAAELSGAAGAAALTIGRTTCRARVCPPCRSWGCAWRQNKPSYTNQT